MFRRLGRVGSSQVGSSSMAWVRPKDLLSYHTLAYNTSSNCHPDRLDKKEILVTVLSFSHNRDTPHPG